MLFGFNPSNIFSVVASLILLAGLCACGGSSSSDDSPDPLIPPAEFSQKIQIIHQSDSLLLFTVETATNRFELYSFDLTSGARSAITDYFSANNGLRPFGLNFDNSLIAYRADKDNDGVDELYANLLDGSDEVLLTDAIGTATTDNSGTSVHYNWQWLFGSSSLIFRSDPDDDGIFEIQSIAANGSGLVEVSGDLSVKCLNEHCWKTQNQGRTITFMVESVSAMSEVSQTLYSVTSSGSALTQLNQDLNADSRILGWEFSNDDTQVVYVSQNIGSPAELYIVGGNGTNRTLLSNSGLAQGVSEFQLSPDNSRIAFSEDSSLANQLSLYSVERDGTNRRHLLDTINIANPNVIEWQWLADSERIGYRADQNTIGVMELFTVSSDGQFHRQMNPPMASDDLLYEAWLFSPDGQFVSFAGEFATERTFDELYISAADGSRRVAAELNLSDQAIIEVAQSQWTADSSRLLFPVSGEAGLDGIYALMADGSNTYRVSETLEGEHALSALYLSSPDSAHLIYQVITPAGDVGLQVADINGGNRTNLVDKGQVSRFVWLTDSSRILYVHQTDDELSQSLYSVLPTGLERVEIY